jgi:hypothetical protein
MNKLIPTALERQKIFYHLKKISSYTAWSRILGYYKAWADIFEKSVSEAEDAATPDKPAEVGTEQLIFVLKCLSACEKSVELLRQGNMAPIRYDGLACFAVAKRAIKYWVEHQMHFEDGDIAFHPERVPYWNEIKEAHRKLGSAWFELESVLETSATDDAAPFALYQRGRDFGFNGVPWVDDHGRVFPPHHFPANLPEVPNPQEVVLVKNGDTVPFSGIYEPIEVPAPKRKLVSLFTKAAAPAGPFDIMGAMNYFAADGLVRHIGEGRSVVPTTWRLLWKDDRYLDGTIPAEEAGYMFNRPHVASGFSAVAAPVADTLVYARSGERASKAGTWAVQDDLQGRQSFALGEILPLHQGREVTWVWTQ